ncbi:MAG: type II toxin-antitoxin system MqsR family toxin [Gallionellaceae bacterium]|jgi:hypothetical protein
MVNDAPPQPFYSLSLIKALVEANHFLVVNSRANNRLEDLNWDSIKIKSFIGALNEGHFVKRYPECNYGNRQIDCDGYKMSFDEDECVEDIHNGLQIFIKLADMNHSKTLIISFHLEGSPG